jgi:fatty acid CoA ligase FadD36
MASSCRGFLNALQQGEACIQVARERMESDKLTAVVGGIACTVAGARRGAITAHPTLDTVLAIAE